MSEETIAQRVFRVIAKNKKWRWENYVRLPVSTT
jgi:hypothetical protein